MDPDLFGSGMGSNAHGPHVKSREYSCHFVMNKPCRSSVSRVPNRALSKTHT